MSNSWIEYQSTSNLLKKTYMKDFLDVSGEMYVRNGSININGNITAGGDITCKSINLASGALDSGVNSAVQTALDGKQATLTAGTNITITGDTISSSSGGSNISSVADGIEFDGNVVVEGDLSVSGNVVVSGSTVYTSDDRIKVNEQKIENALENINKLTPQIYDKRESLDVSSNITVCDSGLIAQDIWYKTPELRHLVNVKNSYDIKHMDLDDTINPDPSYNDYGWPNKPAAVNYIASIAYLVSAIQELNIKYEENKIVINNYKASKNV